MEKDRLLKRAVYWPALFVCLAVIGSVSIPIGHRVADRIQEDYGELIDLHQASLSNGLMMDPSRVLAPGEDILVPAQSFRPADPRVAQKVTASWYGKAHQNKPTASGQKFQMDQCTVAHRTLPLGTRIRLVNPVNGRSVEGTVNDRGPYVRGRDLDVSYRMATQLGFVHKGIVRLHMETLTVRRDGTSGDTD